MGDAVSEEKGSGAYNQMRVNYYQVFPSEQPRIILE
jgi:hypothetical protein